MKSKNKKDKETKIDVDEEVRLDWECAERFNKIIWSKWPESVKSTLGLCEWLQKKGYVVQWQMPMYDNKMHMTRWLADLSCDGKIATEIFRPPMKAFEDEKLRDRLKEECRRAQNSHLVCTSCIRESAGGGMLFALFREKGTSNCLVFVTWQ